MKEKIKIGLKKGTVKLLDHQGLWEINANETIKHLKELFGDIALDIQHIGSTSIKKIKAKPIVDIAVGISNFDSLKDIMEKLAENGVIHCPFIPDQELFIIKNNVDNTINTHHIHVVIYNEQMWNDYLNFRDYLNFCFEEARNYEKIKIKLANKNKENRENYTKNKENYINEIIKKANEWKKIKANPNFI